MKKLRLSCLLLNLTGTLVVLSLVKSKLTAWLMICWDWGLPKGRLHFPPQALPVRKNQICLECLSKMHIVAHF